MVRKKTNRDQNMEMFRAILEFYELDPEYQSGREILIDALDQAFNRNTHLALLRIFHEGESHE